MLKYLIINGPHYDPDYIYFISYVFISSKTETAIALVSLEF